MTEVFHCHVHREVPERKFWVWLIGERGERGKQNDTPSFHMWFKTICSPLGWLVAIKKTCDAVLGQANGCGRPHERPTLRGWREQRVEICGGKERDVVGAPVTVGGSVTVKVNGSVMVTEDGSITAVKDCSRTATEDDLVTSSVMACGSRGVGGGELRVMEVGSATRGTVAVVPASGMDGSMTENGVETRTLNTQTSSQRYQLSRI